MTVRTRFAPSPTGELHLGNLRTALLSALLARRHGGEFVLRIEDTDAARRDPEAIRSLMGDLRWLGLQWDAGPDTGGAHAPYTQSERAWLHEGDLARLRESGHVYPCFCSEAELKRVRAAQRRAGQPPRYPGTCARLGADEVERRRAAGEQPVWRFRVPSGREVRFEDRVHGTQRFATDDLGDFVVARADGSAAYLFANAVDDARMGITHVLRGDDHLTNTPRQLLILEALGLSAPAYAHFGLMLGEDGAPLSKRNGSRSVRELSADGLLPEAILNYLARVGCAGQPDHLETLDGLAAHLRLEGLSPSPARFDAGALMHWQDEAIRAAPAHRLRPWLRVDALIPPGYQDAFVNTVRDNIRSPSDGEAWARIVFGSVPDRTPEARDAIRTAGPAFFEAAVAAAATRRQSLAGVREAVQHATGLKGRRLFMPLRAALTGRCDGPELGELAALMGDDAVYARLQAALAEAQAATDETERGAQDAQDS